MPNNPNQESDKNLSRRNFFKLLSGIFTGFIALVLAFPMFESVVGAITKKSKTIYYKIASLNSLLQEQPDNLPFVMTEEDAYIKYTQQETVWAVKKSAADVTVYSPICPHLGCRFNWHPNQKLFICPCHHSVFNIDGKVISGPAPRPLDTLPKEVKNNFLYVLWERFKPGIAKKEII